MEKLDIVSVSVQCNLKKRLKGNEMRRRVIYVFATPICLSAQSKLSGAACAACAARQSAWCLTETGGTLKVINRIVPQ